MRQLRRPPNRFAADAALIAITQTWNGTAASRRFRQAMTAWCSWNQSGRCCYCGLAVLPNTRVTKALDHIVPKGKRSGRPEWAHLPNNIAMACWHCNSNLKKEYNPLKTPSSRPDRSAAYEFVHPYFDNPDGHLSGGFDDRPRPLAPIRYSTRKGKKTVELFELADARMLRLWQAERFTQQTDLREGTLPPGRLQQRDRILRELRRSMRPGRPAV